MLNARRARRTRSFVTAAFVLLLFLPGTSWSQSGSSTAGKTIGADPQVVNAAQAAEEALKAGATKGEAARGASGAIGSLLIESDNLICSSWILSFRVRYRNMVIQGADAATLRAMETLMEKVEAACERVLNPPASGGTSAGGTGKPAGAKPEPARAEPPIYPECPECDELKRELDRETYKHELAQWELSKAMRRTHFLERIEESNRSAEEKKTASGGETVEQSEKFESRKRAEVDNARMRMDEARADLVKCLEKCNRRTRKKYAGGMTKGTKVAIAGGAAAGVTAVALSVGGSESSVAAAPLPTTTTPTSPPTGAAVAPGVNACAGSYNASFVVSSDPAGHRQFVGMPSQMTLQVTLASIHVRGSDPFVEVNGSIDSSGNFQAAGMGTVAGFRNVTVTMNGTLRDCGASTGTLQAQYSMGTRGELPQGQPITYQVTGRR